MDGVAATVVATESGLSTSAGHTRPTHNARAVTAPRAEAANASDGVDQLDGTTHKTKTSGERLRG